MRQIRIGTLCGVVVLMAVGLAMAAEPEDLSPEGLKIKTVDVVGNVSLSRAEVLSVITVRPGQEYNANDVKEDVGRITALGAVQRAYENIKIADDGVVLSYIVVEHNLVRSIAFKGNKKVKDSVLAKELGFKKGDYLDIFLARAGEEALKEKYKKKGFPWAEVTLEVGAVDYGQVAYAITEGARPKVAAVDFAGNSALSTGALQNAIKTKERKLLFFPVYYDPDQLDADNDDSDLTKLLKIYQRKSFLDADVTGSVTYNEDKSKAYVLFTIHEGPAYFVDSIEFQGNQFFTDEQLKESLKLYPDYFYSEAWADFDAKKIEGRYHETGFIETQVSVRREFLPEARVKVEFSIQEGNRYRLGEVVVTGNSSFQDRTIRRILDEEGFTPGQWYNADMARGDGSGELEKIVQRSVIAESTVIEPTGSEPDTRDAQVAITEGQTGSIMVGAGIGSDDGLMGNVTLNQRNFDITDTPESFTDIFTGGAFRGAGQQFRLSASPGTEWSSYSASFTEPYLYDRPISLSLGGSLYERERETYDEERLAGTIGLEKRYDNKWRRGISFTAENVDISDLDWDAPREVQDEEGDNALFGTRFYVSKDATNSRFLPNEGHSFNFGYEQFVGDYTFGVLEGTYRWYHTLAEDLEELKTVLETKIHAGTTIGDSPTFERFYVGGTGRWGLRGFEYRGISPRSGPSDEPIGSEWAVTGNAEISVPLGSETFSWLFFTDVGMIDDGGPRASVGTGIQMLIPQFFGPVPMRFELASPFLKDSEDDTQVFSFSMGALF